jgi:cytochrome c oxidase accessory protein FixG
MCPGSATALASEGVAAAKPGQPPLVSLVGEVKGALDEQALAAPQGFDNQPDDEPLYEPRKKIHPQRVTGTFRRLKWALLIVGLFLYYFLPFLRWDRGPNAPHQAVLVDLDGGRFYFFFIEIWPQEVYYLTGLLIMAAMMLFLMNAIAGRVWCGYLCPQTVWTDLYIAIERWIEGDRRKRLQLEQQPWTFERAARAASKHFWWLLIAWWTGGAWVLYFADAPTLVKELATFQAPPIAYVFIGILTFTTYALAGWMREQVCVYMCPWPRIQAALTDEYALNVTYRYDRGEPRASLKKAAALHAKGQPAGDCIDCQQCLNVCPGGVDIRQGAGLGCIQCGLCIDACDAVMAKIGRPPRLIAYDTDLNIRNRQLGKPPVYRIVRMRTVLYAVIIVAIAALMTVTMATRRNNGVDVIHDRNPQFVRMSDGAVRNGYAVHILNKSLEARGFLLTVSGLADADIEVIGSEPRAGGEPVIEVGPDQSREVRVLVTTHENLEPGASIPLTFSVAASSGGPAATAADHFLGP